MDSTSVFFASSFAYNFVRKNIFNLNSIRKVAEEKMMMLRRWAVGPLGRWAVRKQFVSGAYLFKFYTQHP